MVFKVVSWAILQSFTQFPWVSPMYTEGIYIKLVFFFSCESVFYYGSLRQELRRTAGNLLLVVIQGVVTERMHKRGSGTLEIFSFLIWILVTYVCSLGEILYSYTLMICALYMLYFN